MFLSRFLRHIFRDRSALDNLRRKPKDRPGPRLLLELLEDRSLPNLLVDLAFQGLAGILNPPPALGAGDSASYADSSSIRVAGSQRASAPFDGGYAPGWNLK